MVEIHTDTAGNESRHHQRELSARLSLKEASAASTAVASVAAIPVTNWSCRKRADRSGRSPCARASKARTAAASNSQTAARTNGGRNRFTGVTERASESIKSDVFMTRSRRRSACGGWQAPGVSQPSAPRRNGRWLSKLPSVTSRSISAFARRRAAPAAICRLPRSEPALLFHHGSREPAQRFHVRAKVRSPAHVYGSHAAIGRSPGGLRSRQATG